MEINVNPLYGTQFQWSLPMRKYQKEEWHNRSIIWCSVSLTRLLMQNSRASRVSCQVHDLSFFRDCWLISTGYPWDVTHPGDDLLIKFASSILFFFQIYFIILLFISIFLNCKYIPLWSRLAPLQVVKQAELFELFS